MKKIFALIFLLITTTAFALPPMPPTSLSGIDALFGTTSGAVACSLLNNGTCGTPVEGTLTCSAGYPVTGSGQCGSAALGTGAYATIANYQPVHASLTSIAGLTE